MGFQPHRLATDRVLAQLETSLTGLDEGEAQRRLARHGPNSSVGAKRTRWWRIQLHQFTGALVVFSFEWNGNPERLAYARVAALTTLVMFPVFHVGNCRSERSSAFRTFPFANRLLFFGVMASTLLHIGAMHFGPTQNLLHLEPLRAETWLLLIPVALTIVVAMELHKAWIYLRAAAPEPSTLPLGSRG